MKQNIIIKYTLLVLTATLGFWILVDHILFSNNPGRMFYTHELIIILCLFLGLLGALIFFLFKKWDYKPSVITLGILSLLFIILLIKLLVINPQTFNVTSPSGSAYSFTSSLTNYERFKYIVHLFVTFIIGFFMIDILPKALRKDEYRWLLYFALGAIYVLIIISYFTDFRSYINIITFKQGNSIYDNGVKSIFPHKTVFGYILMMGGFVALYLYGTQRKWYWLVNVGIVFIHLICTLSKLAIIIFFIAALAYLIYLFFSTYKENPKLHKKILFIVLGVLGTVLLIGVLLYFIPSSISAKLKDVIHKLLYPSGYNTFTTRTWIWSYTMQILKQTSFSLGAGYKYFGTVLKQANLIDAETALVNNTSQTHNAYISMLANGGILLLVAYLLFIALLVQIIVKLCKTQLNIGVFYALGLLALLVYGIFEAAPIVLASSAEHALGGALIVTGILMEYRLINKEQ